MATSTFATVISTALTDSASIFTTIIGDVVLFVVGVGMAYAVIRWIRGSLGARKRSV